MHLLLGDLRDLTLSSQRGRHMSIFPVHQLTRFAISLYSSSNTHVQSSAIVGSPGLVNFITAVAYHLGPGRTEGDFAVCACRHPPSSNESKWTRKGQSARQVSKFAKGR